MKWNTTQLYMYTHVYPCFLEKTPGEGEGGLVKAVLYWGEACITFFPLHICYIICFILIKSKRKFTWTNSILLAVYINSLNIHYEQQGPP